jgi:5-methylcytosine-specific restriction protein A
METKARDFNWTRDEAILALDLYFQSDRRILSPSDPRAIGLSKYLNSLELYPKEQRTDSFRNPSGIGFKLANFRALDPTVEAKGLENVAEVDRDVWAEFGEDPTRLHAVALSIRRNAFAAPVAMSGPPNPVEPEDEFPEGRILLRTHQTRERNSKAIKDKKAEVLRKTGTLLCEVCNFNFQAMYGERGREFIECHHTVPLAELTPGQKTRIADLALVCANCHRMLHRGGLISINDLRAMLERTALAP